MMITIQTVVTAAICVHLLAIVVVVGTLTTYPLMIDAYRIDDNSPTSLGLRSGLFHCRIRQRRHCDHHHHSKTIASTKPIAEDDDKNNDEYDTLNNSLDHDHYVQSAFLQIKSRQDVIQARTTSSAFLTKIQNTSPLPKQNRYMNGYTTELDSLEQQRSSHNERAIDSFSTRTGQNRRNHNRYIYDTLDCKTRTVTNPARAATKATAIATTTTTTTVALRPLVFWENMICGAISRSMAQTMMHPANTMKTILQNSRRGIVPNAPTLRELVRPQNFQRLTVGAGANFLLSVPHGAVNFAVLEFVRNRFSRMIQSHPILAANENKFSFGLDFLSSSISTVACSIVSTPQMMIVDNIMVGNYPNLKSACIGLAQTKGVYGFYAGWWPGLVGKIPSYALTWTFFQQLKKGLSRMSSRPVATDIENSIMGCLASAATVCLMIPMDTIKTRRTYCSMGNYFFVNA
jgi:Mitochondrial carrier protein